MLTPQEIQEKRFEKAVFGGYDMGGVDTFLESVVENYTALYKDNAVLKNKLKVLVDKVEEYRSVDDIMRKTLLTAQKNAHDIMEKAQAEATELTTNAQKSIRDKSRAVARDIEQEQARLDAAKQETMRFVTQLRELYQKELDLLSAIPSLPATQKPKSVRDDTLTTTARQIEDSIQAQIAMEAERATNQAAYDAQMAREAQAAQRSREGAPSPQNADPRQAANAPPEGQRVSDQTRPIPPTAAPLPSEARVYEVKFGAEQEGDFSDIWTPEEDTLIPRPRTDFKDLDLEFGPGYQKSNPHTK